MRERASRNGFPPAGSHLVRRAFGLPPLDLTLKPPVSNFSNMPPWCVWHCARNRKRHKQQTPAKASTRTSVFPPASPRTAAATTPSPATRCATAASSPTPASATSSPPAAASCPPTPRPPPTRPTTPLAEPGRGRGAREGAQWRSGARRRRRRLAWRRRRRQRGRRRGSREAARSTARAQGWCSPSESCLFRHKIRGGRGGGGGQWCPHCQT
jgi:hypothetical protein